VDRSLTGPVKRSNAQAVAVPIGGCLIAIFSVLSYYLLLSNPGYFSHDELQWGARADVAHWRDLPWQAWTDFTAFQHRPLTFNLWLLIAYAWFEQPALMHLLWVAMGLFNAALLFGCLKQLRATTLQSLGGAAAFAISPFAIYAHGWTATLADLLWLAAALALLQSVLRLPTESRWRAAFIALVFTSIGLLAKEAALAIAPLLLFAWLVSGRQPRLRAALMASGAVTAGYLWLRLPTLLYAPRPEGTYAWSLSMPLKRWAEMQLYPYLPTALEFASVSNASTTRFGLALLIAVVVAATFVIANRRIGATYLFGGAIAMGPPLVLAIGYPQYGYGYAALICGCGALAWPQLRARGQSVLLLALVLASWHGYNIAREMHRIGAIQARYSPALADAVSAHRSRHSDTSTALRLALEVEADRGVFERLSRQISNYAGVAIGDQVKLVDRQQTHHAVIGADGSIRWAAGAE